MRANRRNAQIEYRKKRVGRDLLHMDASGKNENRPAGAASSTALDAANTGHKTHSNSAACRLSPKTAVPSARNATNSASLRF